MKDSELRLRAKNLALKIIYACDEIDTRKGRGVLVNQITRSATSVGANIQAKRTSLINFILHLKNVPKPNIGLKC